MASRMEMIYIDREEAARHTGVGAIMDSPAETWAAFRSARRLEVPINEAVFLLDYYNRRGDLADTIALSAHGFTRITGEQPKTDEEYRAIDAAYWTSFKATPPAAAPTHGPRVGGGDK